MKKNVLLLFCLVLVSGFTCKAQDTLSKYNAYQGHEIIEAGPAPLVFPAAKYAITLDPLASLGSGLAMGAEMFKGKIAYRVLGGFYYGTKPWFYDGYSSDNYSSLNVTNMSGYRLEFQVKKELNDDKYESHKYYLGLFTNLRSIKIDAKSAYTFNPNGGPSTFATDLSLKGQAVTFGPMFSFSKHFTKWFIDAHAGPGMIIDVGGKNNADVGLSVVNPYQPGVMLKFGVVLGLNMN